MAFLQSTYEAAADLGRWERAELECELGEGEGEGGLGSRAIDFELRV